MLRQVLRASLGLACTLLAPMLDFAANAEDGGADYIGHVMRTVEDAGAQKAAFEKAAAVLAPITGVPGGVSVFRSDIVAVDACDSHIAAESARLKAAARRAEWADANDGGARSVFVSDYCASLAAAAPRVYFRLNSAELRPQHALALDAAARAAKSCSGATLIISGHTDGSGADDINQRLAEERAETVRAALVERGVDASQLEVLAYAARRPSRGVLLRTPYAPDRRVEFGFAARTPGTVP